MISFEGIISMLLFLLWMVEYAGALATRFSVGEDGKTAYERMKGRRFKEELVEWGEVVMYEVVKEVREEGGYERARAPPPGGSEGWDTRG